MKKVALPIWWQKIVQLLQDTMTFVVTLKEILSSDVFGYLVEKLGMKAIPKFQLLIKDYKKKKNITT
eukprot:10202083-Ditylum_brightwellii.AAC.1